MENPNLQGLQFELIDFQYKGTELCMAIDFELDGKKVYTVERSIDFAEKDENDKNLVGYGFVRALTDKYLNDDEIRSAVVYYLAQHKLYLHNYTTMGRKTFVSYNSDSPKVDDLKYGPAGYHDYVFLKIHAQPEDGVNYDEVFDTRIRGAINSISDDELAELGYDFGGYVSIEHDTLLSADELPAKMVDIIENGGENFEFFD